MDDDRLEQLEQRLAKFEAKFDRCHEGLFLRMVELECKVETLQKLLANYDMLVQMAGASYVHTHPEAAKAMLDAADFLNGPRRGEIDAGR